MLVVARRIALLLTMFSSLCLRHAVSQPQDPKPVVSVDPPTLTSNQPGASRRIPHEWIAPLPHVSGENSPESFGLGLMVPDSVRRYWRTHTPNLSYDASLLARSADWSAFDSPVKAQGQCGSCWAFAVVAAIENAGLQNDLSEQVLVSCSEAGTCGGGYYENALRYVRTSGLPDESSYPYAETNGDCTIKQSDPTFLERVTSVTTSMWGDKAQLDDLKAALQNGPVIGTMLVYADFYAYKSGIYHHSSGAFKGYHAVLIVGYNDDLRCFKAKNSWGSSWGEGGYFRIAYDDLANGVEFGGFGAQLSGVYTEYLTTAVVNNTEPITYVLEQNYPNPFNPRTVVSSQLPVASDVQIVVYDMLGREVAVLVSEHRAAGRYRDTFDGSGLASGTYVCRIVADAFVATRTMILLR